MKALWLPKIDKKKLAEISILTVVFQMAVLYLGSLGSGRLMHQEGVAENEILLSNVIAAIIFAGLGVHLIIKAVRNERIYEHRQDTFSWKKSCWGLSEQESILCLQDLHLDSWGFV